jgi:hypothetical protein
MKRAFVEWGAIVTFSLSLLCFAYWATSINSDFADFELSFGWQVVQMSASDGTITLCNDFGNSEVIEEFDKGIPFFPPLAERYGWAMPGFRFRWMTWGDSPLWTMRVSLLIPAALLMLVAGYFIRRYRKIRATVVQSVPTLGGPVQHPLD